MPEQKGRGGKKPKYQIADIGGDDLTSEDISTERVLNFLIKGEAASPEQTDSIPIPENEKPSEGEPTTPPLSAQTNQDKPLSDSLPSSATPPKKSLAHLYERASGGGTIAKELPLKLPAEQEKEIQNSQEILKPEEVWREHAPPETNPLTSVPPISDSSNLSSPSGIDHAPVVLTPELEIEKDQQDTLVPVVDIDPELTRLIELWKNFYRLKSGEVEALTVMYRLTHGNGRSECFIKMHNLAEMSNLTYRYCQKVVRSLEQLGWIIKLKDYDPTDQLGVLYRVNLNPQIPSANS